MTGRVLNFSEFQDKYSTDAQQDSAASYSEFSTASDNFQTAFDDASYEGPQLGPKRPVSGGSEMTPAQPGETGAPAFSSDSSGMEAPDYTGEEDTESENEITNPTFGNYSPDSSGNPEDDEDDDDEADDDDESDEDDNDESDEDAKEKNESRFWNKSRSSMILESFESFTMSEDPLNLMANTAELDSYSPEGYGDQSSTDEPENWVRCQSCGATQGIEAGHDPFAEENIDNPNEWWQGYEAGMQCGCNM